MNAPKNLGIVLVMAGTALMLSALSLFFYNQYQDAQAGRQAENLLADVQAVIKEKRRLSPPSQEDPAKALVPELPVAEINGYGSVGYLSIPELGLELPVMSEWDDTRLKIAPCRQFGSSRTDDLVIAAHNYKNHFGQLFKLEVGCRVAFTDMDGVENLYEAAFIDTLAPTEVEAVQNSDYDLVLYTCTFDGQSRVTVFCNRLVDSALPVPSIEGDAAFE